MSALLDLAARVEALIWADREVDAEIAKSAFRVSSGPQNWLDDIDRFVVSIKKNMKRRQN